MLFPLSLLALLALATPAKLCSVLDYGARGDNVTEDTPFLQAAIDACTPGTTIFPSPGKYLSRSLNLTGKSNIELVIEAGAALVLWSDIDTYNASGVFNDFIYTAAWNRTSLITAPLLSNISIHGGGTIDGQGWRWWPSSGSRARPRLISLVGVNGLRLDNLTLRDSPSWNTNLRGAFMSITNMRVESNVGSCRGYYGAPNTDAFNIGGHDIYLADNQVHNGDDCIPVFAWNNEDTYNVLAERVECNCGTNGGVVILGDDTCGGAHANIYNVTFRDMVVTGTNQGAGVKICESYMIPHGLISNITWENYTIRNPRNTPLYTNVIVEDGCSVPRNLSRTNWLSTEGLAFRGVRANVAPHTPAGCFVCTDERPCSGMVFEDVVVEGASPYVCQNAHSASAAGSSPAPCG